MPSFLPRNSPANKVGRLRRRESALIQAIHHHTEMDRLIKLAENVRHFQLQVLKARKVITEPAADTQHSEQACAELNNIERETVKWQKMPNLEILSAYGFIGVINNQQP